ncbi:MAG TPA: sensory rhodopsin transducer [Steroidobacteraceae bacterium]|nr:sensory rhodopsin transducer [Steroidobacteraceae bacterium]
MIGHRTWAIAEGYIPGRSVSESRELQSHETACILNAADTDANIEITLYFEDRGPAGPYRVKVPSERTLHLRFNDLQEPERVPRDTAYSSIIRSDVPVVVQHTRLDTRDTHIALLSTVAYPVQG